MDQTLCHLLTASCCMHRSMAQRRYLSWGYHHKRCSLCSLLTTTEQARLCVQKCCSRWAQ